MVFEMFKRKLYGVFDKTTYSPNKNDFSLYYISFVDIYGQYEC